MSWPRRLLLLFALGVVLAWAFGRTTASYVLDGLIWLDHREVPTLSTDELAARSTPPVLLDVRPVAEFAVSHLVGARQVDPGADLATLSDLPKDAPIVTYCSVGARSADLAERLVTAGYTDVHNLRGSIFRWAREGRPLVNAKGPTKRVHPYSDAWGLLVDDDLHGLAP